MSERARAPCLRFQCFGRSRATTQPLVRSSQSAGYEAVEQRDTNEPSLRRSVLERREEERERNETNESSIGRNTQLYTHEREAIVRTLLERTHPIERQSSGDIEKAIFVAGSRVTYESYHTTGVCLRREKKRATDRYIASSSRINIHEGRSVYALPAEEKQRSSRRLTPTRCGVVGKISVFLRVYVIFERELRCRIVATTFAAVFISVQVVRSLVAIEKVREAVPPRLFDNKEETTNVIR